MIVIAESMRDPLAYRKKTGHVSRTLTLYTAIGFMGLVVSLSVIYMPLTQTDALLVSFMGCLFAWVSGFAVIILVYSTKVAALFDKLKEDERVVIFLNRSGNVMITVFKMVHDALLFRAGYGFLENNGWQLKWGKKSAVIALQGYGDTLNPQQAGYQTRLRKEGVKDYEEAIKRYLGPVKYAEFKRRFRVNPLPDIYEIRKEIDYLRNARPADPLAFSINGETINFRDLLDYEYYASTPIALENAIERERINEHELAFSYKPQDKSIKWALAIVLILIGVGILLVMIGNTDMGNMFGGLFGGGGK